jgi:hypothetical protein
MKSFSVFLIFFSIFILFACSNNYKKKANSFIKKPTIKKLQYLISNSDIKSSNYDKRFFSAYKATIEWEAGQNEWEIDKRLYEIVIENPDRSLLFIDSIFKCQDSRYLDSLLKSLFENKDFWSNYCRNKQKKELYLSVFKNTFDSGVFLNDYENYLSIAYVLAKNGRKTPKKELLGFVQSYSYWNQIDTAVQALQFYNKDPKVREYFLNLHKKIKNLKRLLNSKAISAEFDKDADSKFHYKEKDK